MILNPNFFNNNHRDRAYFWPVIIKQKADMSPKKDWHCVHKKYSMKMAQKHTYTFWLSITWIEPFHLGHTELFCYFLNIWVKRMCLVVLAHCLCWLHGLVNFRLFLKTSFDKKFAFSHSPTGCSISECVF